jgi:hypothetical protein
MPRRHMGNGSIAPPFLTSALDGGEWSASRPCRFTHRERAPRTHWIGGWVGPQNRSERYGEEKKISYPAGNINPVVQLAA